MTGTAPQLSPTWAVAIDGTVVDAVATDALVAVWQRDLHRIVAFDRPSGTERWQYPIPADSEVFLSVASERIVADIRDLSNRQTVTQLDLDGKVVATTGTDSTITLYEYP